MLSDVIMSELCRERQKKIILSCAISYLNMSHTVCYNAKDDVLFAAYHCFTPILDDTNNLA